MIFDTKRKETAHSIKRVAAAVLLFLISVMFGTTVRTGAADETTFTETKYDITVSLVTDKTSYEAGETINYTLTVENNRAHYYTSKAQFATTFTEGLEAVSEGAVPDTVQKLESGEKAVLSGSVTGNTVVFPKSENTGTTGDPQTEPSQDEKKTSGFVPLLICGILAFAAVVAAVVTIVVKKKGKGSGPKALAVLLIMSMGISAAASLSSAGTVPVSAADYDTYTVRPYVKVQYAGQEVMIRMVIELHSYPKRITVATELKNNPKSITCHDPSIFKDTDGTYYIFGTHITGGYTSDLRNWTSIDKEFRATFTKETKDLIRAWNTDPVDWYGYLWAPDVVYNPVLGKYCYYLSANGDDWKSNIVMLTSDNITGPYEYAGSVVYGGFTAETIGETDVLEVVGGDTIPDRYVKNGIKNKKWGDKWPNCIDPCVFYDDDGNLWMSYGSWSGGIFLLALDESTGLRDYSVTYENNEHSDEYFGKKIAGGWYVSGEGSYIQKIGDYYWLFMSYGNLEAKGGYNIRVFRSTRPDGDYVDMLGNSPLYDKYIFNYNQSVGVRLFGGYKWRTFNQGQVAQGHNSAFVDDDGKAYIIYHSRTTDGSEGHTVKVHQLFLNEQGWLVAAPYITDGEGIDAGGVSMADIAGDYEVIVHELDIDYKHLEVKTPQYITLNADGTIAGAYEGSWSVKAGTSYITLNFNGDTYSGVALKMNVENTLVETDVFTAVGENTQITVWGSRSID
jgi:beta-xylosidase